jgi:hypothetical protein
MFRQLVDDTPSSSSSSAPLHNSDFERSKDLTFDQSERARSESLEDEDEDDALSRTSRDSLLADAEREQDNNSNTAAHAMREWIRMDSPAADKIGAQVRSEERGAHSSSSSKDAENRGAGILVAREEGGEQTTATEYRVYKRRFFGLFQLVLLNIIVSWDVSCSSTSTSSAARRDADT